MGNWQPWVYPGHWTVDEHNAVLAALRKAEAELERMGKANNEACDRIAELETQLDIVMQDRDFYRDEFQPVSAARDAAEARVKELEAQLAAAQPDRWERAARLLSTELAGEKATREEAERAMENMRLFPKENAAHEIKELRKEIDRLRERCIEAEDEAPPETLEALAKAHFEHRRKANRAWEVMSWEEHEHDHPERHREYLDATAAILRAARPTLDVTPEILRNHCITSNAEEFLAFLNSRIRYGVEVSESSSNTRQLPGTPSADPTDAQVEALARVLEDAFYEGKPHGDNYRFYRNARLHQARAAYTHIGSELAAVTAAWDKAEACVRELEAVYAGRLGYEELGRLGYEGYRNGDDDWLKWEDLDPRWQGRNIAQAIAVANAVDAPLLARIAELKATRAHSVGPFGEPVSNAYELPAAPTDAQIEALARVLDEAWETIVGGKYFTGWHQQPNPHRECRRAQARAACVHIGAELAAVTVERDALRADIDNAVQNAMERLPDFPWKDKTATEAVWGLSLAVKGELDALDALRAKLAAVTAERDKLLQLKDHWMDSVGRVVTERDALRAELAARATRPVKVRWNVTAEDLADVIGRKNNVLAAAKEGMDYLLDKAVTDVPPGVPSEKDLAKIALESATEFWFSQETLGTLLPVYQRDLERIAAAIRDAVLASVGQREPVAWELDTPENGWLTDGFCIFSPATGESHSLDSFVSYVASRIRPVYECQECAAAKRAVQIERDGVNALAARITAARAALEGTP